MMQRRKMRTKREGEKGKRGSTARARPKIILINPYFTQKREKEGKKEEEGREKKKGS